MRRWFRKDITAKECWTGLEDGQPPNSYKFLSKRRTKEVWLAELKHANLQKQFHFTFELIRQLVFLIS